MIDFSRDNGIWTAMLNRPDKANALTESMLAALADFALEAAGQARVFVLRGAGKVFSAGADLDHVAQGLALSAEWERLSGAVAALPCLSIAALNGTVAGGATGMALACDIRIAVPEARFFYPVMRLGVMPQPSDVRRMVALAGPARAKLVLMAGARLSAAEALAFGLIDRVVEGDALDDTLAALSAGVLGATPEHAAAIKALIG